jgi:hypothetical protein
MFLFLLLKKYISFIFLQNSFILKIIPSGLTYKQKLTKKINLEYKQKLSKSALFNVVLPKIFLLIFILFDIIVIKISHKIKIKSNFLISVQIDQQ